MAEPPPVGNPQAKEIAKQLDKTAADLRTLGEQLGAIPHSSAKAMSPQRAWATFLVVLAVSALVAWFLWEHWHSVLVAFVPLLWIFGSARRWRRAKQPSDEQG